MAKSTFLELSQQLRANLGLSGSGPASVTSQTGSMARGVKCIQDANAFLCGLWADWKFLHVDYTATLPNASSELAAVSAVNLWDLESIWLNKQTSDALKLTYIGYKEYRDTYYVDALDTDEPTYFTIAPDGRLLFDVITDQAYPFSGEYHKKADELTEDSSLSDIPEQYEQCIIEKAKELYGRYLHDSGLYETSLQELSLLLARMEQEQLPGRYGTVSQTIDLTVVPE